MIRVRVEPAGFELNVGSGETVFDAALRQGVSWPTICYGQARCTACACRILDGHDDTGPVEEPERSVLKRITGKRRGWSIRDTRLACQMVPTGDITLEKKGAKPADDGTDD